MTTLSGLGHTAGSLIAANIVVRGIRSALPKRIKPVPKLSYLQMAGLQSKRMLAGQISIKQYRQNMARYRR